MLTTPSDITPSVKKLCRELSHKRPTFLPFSSTGQDHRPRCCFHNSAHCVQMNGGEIVFGWTIWDGGFTEAEFHGVWKNVDGQLIDVTPRVDGEQTILFLPDPVRKFKRVVDRAWTYLGYSNYRLVNGRYLPGTAIPTEIPDDHKAWVTALGVDESILPVHVGPLPQVSHADMMRAHGIIS